MKYSRLLISMLFGISLVGALAVAPAHAAGPSSIPPGLEKAIAAQERHTDALMANPWVVGTAVGHGADGRGAVFVFTLEPGVTGIPNRLDGVPVVSHVTGEIFALGHCKGKHANDPGCDTPPAEEPSPSERWLRPVPIGVSTGHPEITAGTIGVRLVDDKGNSDPADDIYYALSNNHVYADNNKNNINTNVLQPGTFDGGKDPADAIGKLRDFVEIDFNFGAKNHVDAAIAEIMKDAITHQLFVGNATPSDGYGTPSSTTVLPIINARLEKYGRTTGLTKAMVWALNSTVDVNYGTTANPLIATFEGQIIAKGDGFSRGGDSGSLVVQVMGRGKNKNYNPVGLLFAGSDFFELTWLNPIDLVLDSFNNDPNVNENPDVTVNVTIDGE
jgi:hypothetical protein